MSSVRFGSVHINYSYDVAAMARHPSGKLQTPYHRFGTTNIQEFYKVEVYPSALDQQKGWEEDHVYLNVQKGKQKGEQKGHASQGAAKALTEMADNNIPDTENFKTQLSQVLAGLSSMKGFTDKQLSQLQEKLPRFLSENYKAIPPAIKNYQDQQEKSSPFSLSGSRSF